MCFAKLIIRVSVNACSREPFARIITRIVRANNSRECETALKPNFKFSELKFFGETPFQLGCAQGSLGQSLARVKN